MTSLLSIEAGWADRARAL